MDGIIPRDVPAAVHSGPGCHGGQEILLEAASRAGKTEAMAALMRDYPRGPHDQPQSMCPAFGSLRVGLRMRRVATVLCGSACCVYGLTFTSRFYGARRSVGYVPFNSESLVRGQLFEDIRDAVLQLARPADNDAVVVINLCVPTASGVPLDLLPRAHDGVRIIGIDVPGFGVPTHAEAKDVLAAAMLRYARAEAEAGPVARPRAPLGDHTVALIGEMFPLDPATLGAMLEPMGLSVAPPTPAREWRDLYGALDCTVAAAIHPFYVASVREFAAAGRPVVGSAPIGLAGTEAWLQAIGEAAGMPGVAIDAACARALPPRSMANLARLRAVHPVRPPVVAPRWRRTGSDRACRYRGCWWRACCEAGGTIPYRRGVRPRATRAALAANRLDSRITLSGYEGSELLVARLLIEAGATIPYVGTACPRTPWSDADRDWLEARGTHVQFRASLEQDLAAMRDVRPDLAIGTTPVVQQAKELGIPSIYFTNMVSARPLFGPAGVAAITGIVRAQTRGRERFGRMVSFFADAPAKIPLAAGA